MRRCSIVLVTVLLGCAAGRKHVASHPEDPRAELRELADAIDPGEAEPIAKDVPDWLADKLRITDRPDVAAMARRLASDPRLSATTLTTDAGPILLELLRITASLERSLAHQKGKAALDTKFVLMDAYDRLDVPVFADEGTGAFARLRSTILAGIDGEIAERFDEAWPVLAAAPRRAGVLHYRLLVELLRDVDPSDPRLASAMLHASVRVTPTGPTRYEVDLAKAAIRLRGERASFDDLLEAASVCGRALDVAGAEALLARARKLAKPGDAGQFGRLEVWNKDLATARRIEALGQKASVDDDLERAYLLFDFGRSEDALGIFASLSERHPNDARVLLGLWRMELQLDFDFEKALARLEEPRGELTNKTREYYEYAVGVRAAVLFLRVQRGDMGEAEFNVIFADTLPKVASDARALAALGSDAGVVISYLIDLGPDAMKVFEKDPGDVPLLADRVLRDMSKLRERFPDSPYVYRVLLAAATQAEDRAAAERALALPVPKDGGQELAWVKRRAQFSASIRYHHEPPYAELAGDDDKLSKDHRRELARMRADAEAIAARKSGTMATWSAVVDHYAEIMEHQHVIDVRHANALAVAMIQAGQREKGVALLEQTLDLARTVGDGGDVPLLNLVALGERPVSELALLVSSGDASVRDFALALLIEGSRGKERKRWERRRSKHPDLYCDAANQGITVDNALRMFVGYSTTHALSFNFAIDADAWLLVDAAREPLLEQSCGTRPVAPRPGA